jgi:hypothetical protein
MILSFTTQWKDGTPTRFPERIWEGLNKHFHHILTRSGVDAMIAKGYKFDISGEYNPKIHTIREDETNRWKEGNNIHFRIFNRTPKTHQFAPVLTCISTQKISIIKGFNGKYGSVYVDGKALSPFEIKHLAINDGFDSTGEFFKVFNGYFTGKIIHWTDLKY